MASLQETLDAFVTYVQQELFKRPFLNSDTKQESIMLRRGGGPRQLTGLDINDLEVVGKQNGAVGGIPISSLLEISGQQEKKLVFTQETAAIQWTVEHTYNSTNVEVYVVDASNNRVEPDSVTAVDADTVVINFTQAQAGKAFLRWFD